MNQSDNLSVSWYIKKMGSTKSMSLKTIRSSKCFSTDRLTQHSGLGERHPRHLQCHSRLSFPTWQTIYHEMAPASNDFQMGFEIFITCFNSSAILVRISHSISSGLRPRHISNLIHMLMAFPQPVFSLRFCKRYVHQTPHTALGHTLLAKTELDIIHLYEIASSTSKGRFSSSTSLSAASPKALNMCVWRIYRIYL